MKLYVMRHGPDQPDSVDPRKERERSLTDDGAKVVLAMADAMMEAGEVPKVIFCSPFQRAVETADIVGRRLEIAVNIVGDFAPDRPIEDSILAFMAHNELKKFMIVGHHDNTTPAFNKFGGQMEDCLLKEDGKFLDEESFWPPLVKAEVRRVSIHREFGFWRCKCRMRPSDLGFDNEAE